MVFYLKEKLEAGEELKMIHIRSSEEIKKISRSCQIVADTLIYLEDYIKPGQSVIELDQLAEDFIKSKVFLVASVSLPSLGPGKYRERARGKVPR